MLEEIAKIIVMNIFIMLMLYAEWIIAFFISCSQLCVLIMIKKVDKDLIPAFLMWLFDNNYKIISSNPEFLVFLKNKNGKSKTAHLYYKNLGLNKVGTEIYYRFCNEYLKNGKDFINNLNARANQSQHIYSLFKFFGVKHEKL